MEHTATGQDETWQDIAWNLGSSAMAADIPKATVSAKLAHWGDHVSISFDITLQCPQTDAHIQAASHHAAVTAARFVNELASRYDSSMPMLPTQW